MYNSFYGLEFDPFCKDTCQKNPFKSNDFSEATSRLEHLKNIKGIGLFTGAPGSGKTYVVKQFITPLNPNLYKFVYIPLSTISVLEFYKAFADGLGLEPSFKKFDLFKQIQEQIITIVKEKKMNLICIIDEAQYLKTEVLNDLKILLNFDFDSTNLVTLILIGQPVLNNTLTKQVHDALAQRIVINYMFTGITKEEISDYISSRLKSASGTIDIFNANAIEAIYACSNASIRKLNNIITKCLMVGYQMNKNVIDTEVVLAAQNEIELI